jgi:hypothetical protein
MREDSATKTAPVAIDKGPSHRCVSLRLAFQDGKKVSLADLSRHPVKTPTTSPLPSR